MSSADEALDTLWRRACDTGRHAEAIEPLRNAIAAAPEVAGYHFMLGVALQGVARYDEAHASLREALRLRLRHEALPAAPPLEGPRVRVPRTTLACVDCRNHELAVVALRRSMAQCAFERAVLFTNRKLELPDIEVVMIPDVASIADYSRFMIKALGEHVQTDFVLVVQYDGYVLSGKRWRAEFLDYDYLGAPWSTGGVGNGGFSLRSRKLLDALRDARIGQLVPGDIAICRTYRDLLEGEHGIRIAPVDVASRFSFETLPPPEPTLGFHGITHMVRVIDMSEEELAAYRPAGMVTYERS